jgi:hypothetical protein
MLPKTLRIEGLPDNKNRAALMWGPLVLAGDLGPERGARGPGAGSNLVPSFVTAEKPIGEWLQPAPDRLGIFRTVGVGRALDGAEKEVEFAPFYRLHRRTYGVYWDLYTPDAWRRKLDEYAVEVAKKKKLEAATIGFVQPGADTEKSFNQQGEETNQDRIDGRTGRRTRKWFSYELPIDPATTLVVTFHTDERAKRSMEIFVDSQRVGERTAERTTPGSPTGRFFDVDYKLAPELLKDKKKVTVKFQATGGNETPTVFGVRTVRQ